MKYKKHVVEQGSKEWLDLRFNYVTASQCPTVLDMSPYTDQSPIRLFEEKIMRISPTYEKNKQTILEIGHRVEAAAREKINKEGVFNFEPVVITNPDYPELLASLDGFDEAKNVILETKYVGADHLEKIKNGEIAPHHRIQINAQLLVSEAEYCLYYAEASGGDSHTMEIRANADLQKEIYRKACLFNKHIRDGEPPAPGKNDVLETKDVRFEKLLDLQKAIKIAEQRFEDLKKEVIKDYDKYSKVSGPGGQLTKIFRKGSIRYSEISELKRMDLEKYRSKGSVSIMFKSKETK